MLSTYLKLFIIGCVLSTGFIGSYLIYRKQPYIQNWLQISVKALGIGIAFSLLTCLGTSIFIVFIAIAICAIFFFADAAKKNEKLEHMLVATIGGIFIGLTNLASMLLCC